MTHRISTGQTANIWIRAYVRTGDSSPTNQILPICSPGQPLLLQRTGKLPVQTDMPRSLPTPRGGNPSVDAIRHLRLSLAAD